jgi:E3 ubiquitin-protein ligase synoviolin
MAGANFYLYSVGSLLLTIGMLTKEFHQREQFYPTIAHIVKSKGCNLILINMGLSLAVILGRVTKSIFLGQLRDAEVERMTERIYTTIMDILLAMTVFREDFNTKFVGFLIVLIFVKIFHWLAQDRVNYLSQTPIENKLTVVRLTALIASLICWDLFGVYLTARHVINYGPSMMVLFAFEYMILLSSAVATSIKLLLSLYDLWMQNGEWEHKSVYVMYLDFVVDIFQLVVSLAFFICILMWTGLPLHIVRQLYATFISLQKRVMDVVKYRRTTSGFDQRFPEANEEELQRADVCIVCRYELRQGRRLPCGHVLHARCLRGWLERQQTCPICRSDLLAPQQPPAPHLHPLALPGLAPANLPDPIMHVPAVEQGGPGTPHHVAPVLGAQLVDGADPDLQRAVLRVQQLTHQVAHIQEELDQLLITLTALQSRPQAQAQQAEPAQ